ncbi:TPA: GNAT family N-acetyltransferase [Enterobacter bugandensis]|uniref:GNAT family N-acetyltransferase n=1 Tax=Enterobacter bugandensis TaxID=881260 RepID=UPI0020048E64|nr:GNAT family N-acetyltransferase [Enterobacter bugandensis]MCK7115847.1 GNAT family N-acetyltransferase [Enterobacter bugandensis]MCK7447543.1 GNAT family N-acetyltransferase [Enterobacter bugandensis]HCM9242763.1 GNAT family N-acetyltransferase [Enterobacter bugandensis]
MTRWEFCQNRATPEDIVVYFNQCDPLFIASIADVIVLQDYAQKIVDRAWRTEAWHDNTLIGLVAAYYNAQRQQGFITHVSVLPGAQHCGIGSQLLIQSIEHLQSLGVTEINLEVDENNVSAQHLYLKHGFIFGRSNASKITMTLQSEITT